MHILPLVLTHDTMRCDAMRYEYEYGTNKLSKISGIINRLKYVFLNKY